MKLFKKIGIFLKWGEAFERKADSKCPEVLMEFDSNAPRALLPGALAYANPYMTNGTRIRIFIDRVFGGHRTGSRAEALLGYVMAHEIGHILQGISRHSDEGVMREQIPEAIHLEAELRFTDDDVYLIRTGLSKLAESN